MENSYIEAVIQSGLITIEEEQLQIKVFDRLCREFKQYIDKTYPDIAEQVLGVMFYNNLNYQIDKVRYAAYGINIQTGALLVEIENDDRSGYIQLTKKYSEVFDYIEKQHHRELRAQLIRCYSDVKECGTSENIVKMLKKDQGSNLNLLIKGGI